MDSGNNSILPNLSAIPNSRYSISLSLTKDLSGAPRLQDATGKGYPVIDMGAYEHAGVSPAAATTILLTPSAYVTDGGSSITLTATAFSASGTPAGVLDLREDGNDAGTGILDAHATVIFKTSALIPGIHAFIATYAGQGAFAPAVSGKIYVLVNKYRTSLAHSPSSPNPSQLTQSVTFSVHLTSPDNATLGPVVLTDQNSNQVLATLTPDVSGSASFATSSLSAGSHYLQAAYAGDATHASSSSAVVQTVLNSSSGNGITLTSSVNPVTVGQQITFTATVSPTGTTPAGSVTFAEGSSVLAVQPLIAGTATFSTSSLTSGAHTITAAYTTGGANLSATLIETVLGVASTTTKLVGTPSTVVLGQPVSFAVTVTSASALAGAPTGAETLTVGGTTVIGTQTLAPLTATTSQASFSTSTLPLGGQAIQASYNATGNFLGSTAAITEWVVPPSDFTVSLANPAITIQTQHHTTTAVIITSLNSSMDSVSLACGNLPQYLTCTFTPHNIGLIPNGPVSVALYLDTDSVLGYAMRRESTGPSGISLAALLPGGALCLLPLAFARRRRRLAPHLLSWALPRRGRYGPYRRPGNRLLPFQAPVSVAPGTYTIPITATAAASGVTHSATLTLTVTP